MIMLKKYDIVRSLKNLNEIVLKGSKGTILIVYDDFPAFYEVEFVDDFNETLDVLTVQAEDITQI